jgi:hypothetical protein
MSWVSEFLCSFELHDDRDNCGCFRWKKALSNQPWAIDSGGILAGQALFDM